MESELLFTLSSSVTPSPGSLNTAQRELPLFDWGFAFALTYKWRLVLWSLVPFSVKIVAAYMLYTRPLEFEGEMVPEELRNGHHKEIEDFKQRSSTDMTKEYRSDLNGEITLPY